MIRRWIDAVRRNHALEHATVTVLLARHGPSRLAARASGNGFFIFADVDPQEIASCAREALDRLQRGESSLAVSPLCGTNIAVSGLLAAVGATTVLSTGSVRSRFPNAVTAAMLGVMLAQPVGRLVQQYVTTYSDLAGVEIVETRRLVGNLKKVYTRPAGA